MKRSVLRSFLLATLAGAAIWSLSPLLTAQAAPVPAVWLVGGAETPAFAAQNATMHQRWQASAWSACVDMPGADHFTVLQDWAALRGPLADSFEGWWQQVLQQHGSGT